MRTKHLMVSLEPSNMFKPPQKIGLLCIVVAFTGHTHLLLDAHFFCLIPTNQINLYVYTCVHSDISTLDNWIVDERLLIKWGVKELINVCPTYWPRDSFNQISVRPLCYLLLKHWILSHLISLKNCLHMLL